MPSTVPAATQHIEDHRGDHDWLRAFFVDDVRSRNIPPDLASRLFRRLQMLDGATNDQDLSVPPNNLFAKLRGAGD
jgi:proteic killer suppression protein